MKLEAHTNLTEKEKIEISVKQQKQVEKELIANIIPHKNHTLWEINDKTFEIKEAEYIKKPIVIGEDYDKKEVLQRKGFSYVSSLTKKTALAKFKKGLNGSKEILKNPYKL
jgi:hypothetical protein